MLSRATTVLVLDWDSSRSGHARFFSNKDRRETYFILASSLKLRFALIE